MAATANEAGGLAASGSLFGATRVGGPSFTAYDGGSTSSNQTYDAFGRLTGLFDANRNLTGFSYDDSGNLAGLTDALGNTTRWTYDELGQLTQETNELGDSRYYVYDSDGNLVRYIDRDGRVRDYGYDAEGRVTSETWYADVLDADAAQNAENTIHYAYDSADRLVSEWDNLSSVAYVYDTAGRVLSTTQSTLDGPTVVLTAAYDETSDLCTSLIVTIDGVADYVEEYTYDAAGRVVAVMQHGVTGGNAVAEKRAEFTYDDADRLVAIERYLGTQLVVTSDYAYDTLGQLVGLVHRQGTTILASYAYTYEDGGLSQFSSSENGTVPLSGLTAPSGLWMLPVHDTSTITSALAASTYADLSSITSMQSSDGTVSYTYDPTGQLTAADYTGTQPDEVYSYDANGNRTTDGYVTGVDNRLLTDGTYAYLYDAEGNRTARFIDVNANGLLDSGDTTITEYAWDARNRLDTVTDRPAFGSDPTQVVDYLYDTEDRWIGKDVDLDADGIIDQMTRFAYNGPQIILQFDKTGPESLDASNLSHRYLWNPSAVDHLMADEQVTNSQTPGDVVIPLTDHLGTIRDLAVYDPGTYTTTITTHRTYDAYGTLLTESGPIDCLFSFTGRPFDNATDLQNNYHRWYDASVGCWISKDPIGFEGGDANTYRYVGNSPIIHVDPNGLAWGWVDWIVSKVMSGVEKYTHAVGPYIGAVSIVINSDVNGSVVVKSSDDLFKALNDIQAKGGELKFLAVKGHGNAYGVFDCKDNGLFYTPDGIDICIQTSKGEKKVTALLKSITTSYTIITLRACDSAEAAEKMANILRNDVLVVGYVSKALNVLWTNHVLGMIRIYSKSTVPDYDSTPRDFPRIPAIGCGCGFF